MGHSALQGAIWLFGWGILICHFAFVGMLVSFFLFAGIAIIAHYPKVDFIWIFLGMLICAIPFGLLGIRVLQKWESYLRKTSKEVAWGVIGSIGFYVFLLEVVVPIMLVIIGGIVGKARN
jgi:hypothetical protein